ncbi:MAG: hypothetical protein J2P45_29475, partial [Candidatus Dormibacteraeota bacterium]|nr:hypothetical protein [Candidatus Dormibacteraeota bacterium]
GSRPAYSTSNRSVDDAVASAGYYGRDTATQRSRLNRYGLDDRIQLGQLLAGGPETVLAQAKTIHDELGAGILEVIFMPLGGREKTLRSIELFGTRVLPDLRAIGSETALSGSSARDGRQDGRPDLGRGAG